MNLHSLVIANALHGNYLDELIFIVIPVLILGACVGAAFYWGKWQ